MDNLAKNDISTGLEGLAGRMMKVSENTSLSFMQKAAAPFLISQGEAGNQNTPPGIRIEDWRSYALSVFIGVLIPVSALLAVYLTVGLQALDVFFGAISQ